MHERVKIQNISVDNHMYAHLFIHFKKQQNKTTMHVREGVNKNVKINKNNYKKKPHKQINTFEFFFSFLNRRRSKAPLQRVTSQFMQESFTKISTFLHFSYAQFYFFFFLYKKIIIRLSELQERHKC